MRKTKSTFLILFPILVAGFLSYANLKVGLAFSQNPPEFTGGQIFLPIVKSPPEFLPQINAPFFPGTFDWNESAIAWFGKVNPTENYADVRVGYSPTHLKVRVAIFDRRLWYDDTPTPETLTEWDAVSIYLKTSGNSGNSPDQDSYLFTGQLTRLNPVDPWMASWQGSPSGWQAANFPFTMMNNWRGNFPNDNIDDRGWWVIFEIPFADINVNSPPSPGSQWGFGLELFDRDDASGTPIPVKTWPVDMVSLEPASWGLLRFGIPMHSPPSPSQTTVTQIRHGLGGVNAPDAHVGGGFLCGQQFFPDFFNGWGDANYSGDHKFNIQNQHDLADWPCFSKSYLTFPLGQIPDGKVIVSATMRLYQQGNSGQSQPNPVPDSYIQVLASTESWAESTITWNNAPLAWQNYGGRWVTPMAPGSPPIPWDWDVSRMVADAYAAGLPARFILYSSDFAQQHTGKYFLSAENSGGNTEKRPTLIVEWGDP